VELYFTTKKPFCTDFFKIKYTKIFSNFSYFLLYTISCCQKYCQLQIKPINQGVIKASTTTEISETKNKNKKTIIYDVKFSPLCFLHLQLFIAKTERHIYIGILIIKEKTTDTMDTANPVPPKQKDKYPVVNPIEKP